MTAKQGSGNISVEVDADTTTMTYTLTAKFTGLTFPTSSEYAPMGTPIGVTNGTILMTDVSDSSNSEYFALLAGGMLYPGFAMNFYDVFIGTNYVPCMGPTSFNAKTSAAQKKMNHLRKAASAGKGRAA